VDGQEVLEQRALAAVGAKTTPLLDTAVTGVIQFKFDLTDDPQGVRGMTGRACDAVRLQNFLDL
jgi:hypothetical protein